jgi:hypothetical protein
MTGRVRNIQKPPTAAEAPPGWPGAPEVSTNDALWNVAIELYHQDRLKESYDIALNLSGGAAAQWLSWFKLIEAEHVSRQGSRTERLTNWLELEYLPDELGGSAAILKPVVTRACDRVAETLHWQHGSPTLVAILSEAANAPWATNPHGYCMDKYPYEKICLPGYLVKDERELEEAVAHEYAHVVTLALAQGEAPSWLEEAVSMQFESEQDPEALSAFLNDDSSWLPPDELDGAFGEEGEDAEDVVWLAYQQAMWIGRYLLHLDSVERLVRTLRDCGRVGAWIAMTERLFGRGRVDRAFKRHYGRDVVRLFVEAREWVQTLPAGGNLDASRP